MSDIQAPNLLGLQRRIRVLIIDDSPDQRQHYVRLFQRMHFDVQSMDCCGEADRYLSNPELTENEKPDAILTDNVMLHGGIDGLTFARRWKHEYPVLIFSYDEYALKDMREEGFITVDKIEEDNIILSKVNRAIHEHFIYKTSLSNKDNIQKLETKIISMDEKMDRNQDELRELISGNAKPVSTKTKIWEFIKSPNFTSFVDLLKAGMGMFKWIVILLCLFGIVFAGSNPKFQKMIEKIIPVITTVAKTK